MGKRIISVKRHTKPRIISVKRRRRGKNILSIPLEILVWREVIKGIPMQNTVGLIPF